MSIAIINAKLFASFILISLDETTSQLYKSMKLLEKEFKGLKDKARGLLQITSIRIPSASETDKH